MRTCEQFPGMSVLQHGQSVHEWFTDLVGKQERPWRLPKWFWQVKEIMWLWEQDEAELPWARIWDIIRLYQIYHDCGKPYCRVVDEQGRQHFPDHAKVSEQIWLEHAEDTDSDRMVGRLIGMDMLAHTVKGEADEFVKLPEAPILLLTALAEIHSNACHLGALESDSFKIKLKQLDKLGKKFLTYLEQRQKTCR